MKRVKRSALVSLVVGVCHVIAGCGDSEEGSGGASGTTGTDATSGTVNGPTTTTTTASSSSTGGDGGGGGGMADPCEPTDGADIPVTCGIFVNSNADDNGNGQQDSPHNTLAEAVAQAGGANNRIYVCGSLVEAVTVPEGLAIHGDVSCEAGWQWDLSQRTPWEAVADQTPLHFVGGTTPTVITGFRIESRDAETPEGSSIAVIVEGGTLNLARTDVVAGNGSDGVPGEAGVAGANGSDGGDGGDGYMETGGTGGVSTCGGATGGTGAWESCLPNPNGPGCMSEIFTPATLNNGLGGMSGPSTCSGGDVGMYGVSGAPGVDATGFGSISAAGFAGTNGGSGTAGGVGNPGGGGGAKTNPNLWGGGGGSGGCGSAGSTGGTGGGSSIAFISLDATLLFEDVSASVGNGGNGGAGGPSTPGGAGGAGGFGGCGLMIGCTPQFMACKGAVGGAGGAGGAGGNGAGGHALIIAYTGTQSSLDGLDAEAPVNQGGLAGGGNAAEGQSAVELAFP